MIFQEELLIVISPEAGRGGVSVISSSVTQTQTQRVTPVSWPGLSAPAEPRARVESIKPFLRCDQITV